jgi:S1-C subfamily serine protease
MSNQWNSEPDVPLNGSAVPGPDDRPRLGPRPLQRPDVDPGAASVFGRPAGVDGAFSPQSAPRPALGDMKTAPPAPESLASAFGRPQGSTDLLQRPPEDEHGTNGVDPWDPDAAHDPWRDPQAGAVIGPPAVGPTRADDDDKPKTKPAGQLLSLPEVLFGRRVKVSALVLLGVLALVVGAGGGIAAYFIADRGDQLYSDATLAEAQPAKERPPGSVADIAQRVRPAVVTIEVRSDQGAGVGSGAVIDTEGHILTNEHVVTLGGIVSNGQQITVVFNDGQRAEAKLVGSDPKSDLAVIKVDDGEASTVIQLGKSADLAVGDAVIAIGSPLGEIDTVTMGIVSALHRPVVAGEEDGQPAVYDAIQTDAAINHGNSGGPLVDSTGALVGINTSIISTSAEGGSIGLGYAIPIDDARPIAQQLINSGKANHADLGVNAASVSAETADGARVQNVREGGAAAKAGIKQNDVIRKVGDRVIANAAELIVAVRQHKIGDTVPVVLARDGSELTVQVTLQSD